VVDAPQTVREVLAAHPQVGVHVARAIGPDPALLSVLDERLRDALRAARVRELDALVLAAGGCGDPLENASVARLARVWSAHHRLPTSVAFASGGPPSTGEAVREWRRQGRRTVAVGSLFIAACALADRAAELGLEAGAVAVSQPLGASETLARLLLARYCVAALQLVQLPA
jgi:sirohydrochlorin ferrochelatase